MPDFSDNGTDIAFLLIGATHGEGQLFKRSFMLRPVTPCVDSRKAYDSPAKAVK